MSSLQEIADHLVKDASRVLISGHIFPDGDCLGSVAALGIILEKMGKFVVMASPDPLPENLLFLPGADRFCTDLSLEGDFDTFVILDCSVPERLGNLRHYLDQDLCVIGIDHHPNTEGFAHYTYFDPRAAATGEILIDLMDRMGAGLDRDVATCLYVAITTDTGSFQYENTSPETFRKAARLLETGIPAAAINIQLFDEKPLPTVQLLGAALERMKISSGGKVAWMVVEKQLLEKFSARDEHTEGLVNFIRAIKGVEVAILILELMKDKYKISFRSKAEVDVNRLAARLGGGGHARASGSIMYGEQQQVVESVLNETFKEIPDRHR